MNHQLLEKYNIPVPRYTSYPPANYFHDLSADAFLSAIERSNHDKHQPLVSFYLHIPFCRHLCHYCGCNSYAMMNDDVVREYVDALHREIDLVAARLDGNRKISQIHYGGGSPTAIPINYIKELNNHLLSLMPVIDKPEIAIECHPGYLTIEDWEQLVQCGFTRYSLGIQDFDERVLKAVNRRPSLLPVGEIVSLLRESGASINMDLLYGLPYQTPLSFEKTAEQAANLRPDRLVTFSYGHVPWVHKRQQILEKLGLPAGDDKQEMYSRAANVLHQAGYQGIGMDHFVLPDDELNIALKNKQLHRNFQGYCTLRTTGQVYAFGVTGISQLGTAYAQNGRDIRTYIDTIHDNRLYVERGYALSRQEQIVREVIEAMMCNYHFSWSEIAARLSVSVDEVKGAVNYNLDKLKEMEADGLLVLGEDALSMTEFGSPFVRNVVAALDPLMINSEKKFSKPI